MTVTQTFVLAVDAERVSFGGAYESNEANLISVNEFRAFFSRMTTCNFEMKIYFTRKIGFL